MANFDLSDSAAKYASMAPSFQEFKNEMDRRKPIWAKLTRKQKIRLLKSGKDPVFNLAWKTLKFLCDKDLFHIEIGKDKVDD